MVKEIEYSLAESFLGSQDLSFKDLLYCPGVLLHLIGSVRSSSRE